MAKYDKNIGENLYHQAKRLINKSINLKQPKEIQIMIIFVLKEEIGSYIKKEQ